MGRVWHPRRDSCGWPVTALEFPWVTVAPLLIGVTSKEGRGCSGVHLGHCSYGARLGRCMASLGTRVGLAGGAGAGSNCTIFSGKVSLGAPPPPFSLFFLTCYPGLVRSCRQALERRVLPFRPPSPVSRGFARTEMAFPRLVSKVVLSLTLC